MCARGPRAPGQFGKTIVFDTVGSFELSATRGPGQITAAVWFVHDHSASGQCSTPKECNAPPSLAFEHAEACPPAPRRGPSFEQEEDLLKLH
jgi:hypothetical protein